MTQTVTYAGAGAKRNPDGSFTRATGYTLADTIVDPGAPLTNGGDPQFTSIVNGKVDLCVFRNWLDAYYDNPTAPGAINHHVECFQIGGCQGFAITRTAFVNGETHALFCRAWSASAWVPPQTVQGLVLDGCYFGQTRHGYYSVDLMDDLADLSLGATDAKVLNSVFEQGVSIRMSHHDPKGVGVEIAHNKFPGMTMYQLGLWKSLGYNVHDNTYAALNGVSPFPGDKVDPSVDLSYATWAASVGHPVVVPPAPPVVLPPVDPRDQQILDLTARLQLASTALAAATAADSADVAALAAMTATRDALQAKIDAAKAALG